MDRPAKLFLSYARRQPDEQWAARIVQILEQRYGFAVLVDKSTFRTGHDFRLEIENNLLAASAIIFIGSTSSLTSQYCRVECCRTLELKKPLIPLFIEHITWAGFPPQFHALHFEQVFRCGDDNEALALAIGKALLDNGQHIDPGKLPERQSAFDEWAANIHPPYAAISALNSQDIRKFVEDCARKLELRPSHGYHNLNLALLQLRLGDYLRARRHAELALTDLPARPDAYYFTALIVAAQEPIAKMQRTRIEEILRLLNSADALGDPRQGAAEAGLNGLAPLLRAIVTQDYYLQNGLISPSERPEVLIKTAMAARPDPSEVVRLRDSLGTRLSTTSLGLIAQVVQSTSAR